MRQTIEEQIVMENSKLQKLEREAHQWVQQALPNLEKVDNICPQMKRLLDAAEEQNQLLGPNMEHIAEKPMAEKMSILSSLTTLTIDIRKALPHFCFSRLPALQGLNALSCLPGLMIDLPIMVRPVS